MSRIICKIQIYGGYSQIEVAYKASTSRLLHFTNYETIQVATMETIKYW